MYLMEFNLSSVKTLRDSFDVQSVSTNNKKTVLAKLIGKYILVKSKKIC